MPKGNESWYVGQRVLFFCGKLNVTVEDIAEWLNAGTWRVRKIMRDEAKVSKRTIFSLSELFGVTPQEFLQDDSFHFSSDRLGCGKEFVMEVLSRDVELPDGKVIASKGDYLEHGEPCIEAVPMSFCYHSWTGKWRQSGYKWEIQ